MFDTRKPPNRNWSRLSESSHSVNPPPQMVRGPYEWNVSVRWLVLGTSSFRGARGLSYYHLVQAHLHPLHNAYRKSPPWASTSCTSRRFIRLERSIARDPITPSPREKETPGRRGQLDQPRVAMTRFTLTSVHLKTSIDSSRVHTILELKLPSISPCRQHLITLG